MRNKELFIVIMLLITMAFLVIKCAENKLSEKGEWLKKIENTRFKDIN